MDSVPNTFDSLFIGYSILWLIICVYIFSLLKRLSALEKKVQSKINGD